MLRTPARTFALAIALLGAGGASAQDYPTRPITLIVPFPAGGGVDVIGRIVAEKLSASLGQQVIVDNRGGAAGVIGTRVAKAAPPDGYTLVMATSGSIAINPTLYANPGYEPRKDLVPIGLISSTPVVLMAHPSAPQQTLAELIAFAKANSGKLDIGTPPPGTSAYLGAELLKSLAAIDFTIVTYKGTGPLTTDLIGGHVKLALNVLAPALSNLKSGGLRALAVLGPKRSTLLPEVPTSAEAGLPGFESGLNYGLLAPAGTPRAIIDRLNAALRAGVDTPEVRARIAADGGDPMPSSPEEYTADIEREDKKWGDLIRKLKLRIE
ncbi:MAG: tripartite tricarboxylate transporter substrate binding protein [Xanthobacteraceae bacterium]